MDQVEKNNDGGRKRRTGRPRGPYKYRHMVSVVAGDDERAQRYAQQHDIRNNLKEVSIAQGILHAARATWDREGI